MTEPPKTQEELDFRVAKVMSEPWKNSDGYPRNMGNIARKVGASSSDVVSSLRRLRDAGRISQ